MAAPDQNEIRQNRTTLKKYFSAGSQPTQTDFEQLIESTLNLLDDGFSCKRENGVQIAVTGTGGRLLSFFRTNPPINDPDWAVTCGKQDGSLNFIRTEDASTSNDPGPTARQDKQVLTLSNDSKVGINNAAPAFELDVKGTARFDGRFGRTGTVPADGRSYDITGPLQGCHALEVVAGVGLPGKKMGRYALLHAIAMNSFNPTGWLNLFGSPKRIRCTHSWYLSRADRIKLQWVAVEDGEPHEYCLKLRTLRNYGPGINVRYSVTELWPYPEMDGNVAP